MPMVRIVIILLCAYAGSAVGAAQFGEMPKTYDLPSP